LERGSSNPEGESESPILGELNPPNNRRIPQRNQEITTKDLESSPLGVLESGEEMRGEGVSFTPGRVKTTETEHSGFQNRTIRFWLNQVEMPLWSPILFKEI
jgi:hypothetical protein